MSQSDPRENVHSTGSLPIDEDVEMIDLNRDEHAAVSERDRLIVAVDFGTTFSSVAYARVKKGTQPSRIGYSTIKCVDRYPEYKPPLGASDSREDVPTELWYHPEPDLAPSSSQNLGPTTSSVDGFGINWTSRYPSSDEEIMSCTSLQDAEVEEKSDVNNPQASRPECWGFGVQRQLDKVDIPKDNEGRIANFKLLLDDSEATKDIRANLTPIINHLKRTKLIQKEEDLFAHYLTHLLQNAKQHLSEQGVLEDDTPVEFVLCVPAKWPIKGRRVLQTALKSAVKDVRLGKQNEDGGLDLFIVAEPEAAAACVLAEDRAEILFGEVIVILDAGGGTVDAVTYRITNDEPLRMAAEVVKPHSILCGGSYVNQRFATCLLEYLRDERYLEKNGKTIRNIIDKQTVVFENGEKRTIDVVNKHATLEPIFIDDLKEDQKSNRYRNRLRLPSSDIGLIFRDSMRGTREVLKSQLESADAEEYTVNKVILTGGFGESPSLQHYIRNYLRNFHPKIRLLIPHSSPSAVARGAVLRALRKEDGPPRRTQCSYGFLCTEPYEPLEYDAHKKTRPRIDRTDGERYVPGVINWYIHAGEKLRSLHVVTTTVRHTFSEKSKNLYCKEVLYESERKHESHWRHTHQKNEGAEVAGQIVANMTFLKTRGLIQPELPSAHSTFIGDQAKQRLRHWTVEFDLVMIVEGRNLRYEARWPPKDKLREGDEQEVQVSAQLCIAAAFQPGTA